MGVLEHGAGFRLGKVIDLEGHMDPSVEHSDPLVVIDPVDPKRNVAAALSEQKLCEFIDACRRFLNSHSLRFFFPDPAVPMTTEGLKRIIESRGTLLLAISFKAPDIVEDTLYPQLRKAETSVISLLERHEFKAYRGDVWSDDRSAIVLEMLLWELPAIERHFGPPVQEREHSEKFKIKYPQAYIIGCRYAVDLPRRYENAVDLIRGQLQSCGLGKQVAVSIAEGFEVLAGEDTLDLGPDFAAFLTGFLRDPCP
jgi:tRNA nucleotidyltransferase (CCA-adding enzyme)